MLLALISTEHWQFLAQSSNDILELGSRLTVPL